MKTKRKKLAVRVACVLLALPLFCLPSAAGAEIASEYVSEDILENFTTGAKPTAGSALDIKAKAAVLMEPHTGRILYQNNPDERLAPASVTKIMSLLLVMEALENEKLTLETPVTTSEHAASMGGSQIWLEVNETMTVDELLRASVIASANDATVALAEAIAGSEETFVEKMNARAKELGMKNTTFVNCCGLDAEGHLTTARDVALMASALIQHDLIKKYSTVWMDALRDGKSELVNTNKLVRYYKGATGLKTGTTSQAGCCVAATAERDGMELVSVVMGGANSNERFAGAKKMLDYGFANWSFATLSADLTKTGQVAVHGGMQRTLTPEATGTVQLLMEKGKTDKIEQKIELPDSVEAPILAGDTIGKVILMLGGQKIGEIPITSANNVEKITFFNSLMVLLGALLVP